VKPKPKAGNKPLPHSTVHGLDKPGVFTTDSVKTKDAKVAVERLPAAHARFFNELLDEGHGVFPSLSVVGRM
jgi:hypothetical protein